MGHFQWQGPVWLTRAGRFVFLTDSAVGTPEEDNLRHLVINLGDDAPRSRVVPFLTSKHSLDYCLAYADRAIWMGDADFSYVPALGLLNPIYLALRSANINLGSRITPDPSAGDPRPYDVAVVPSGPRFAFADSVTGPGETTTHFSVVDKWGNLVSYTNTIEWFGGKYCTLGWF